MDSYVAEWDVKLTDAEVRRLRSGLSPFDVRPDNIVRYHKCIDGFFRSVTRNIEGKKSSEVVFMAPDLPSPKEKTER